MTHDENVLKVLQTARGMIEDKEHWTTKVAARNKNGKVVNGYWEEASQWCATAAIRRAIDQQHQGYVDETLAIEVIRLVERASRKPQMPLHEFNDHVFVTHEDVIEAFTKAIDSITEKEAEHLPV